MKRCEKQYYSPEYPFTQDSNHTAFLIAWYDYRMFWERCIIFREGQATSLQICHIISDIFLLTAILRLLR